MTRRGSVLRSLLRDDTGSGSVLAVAVIAAVVMTAGLLLGVVGALVVKHRVQNGSEAAALAAADVASGLVAGYPCEAAERAASLSGSRLVECSTEDGAAEVTVAASWVGVDVTVRSRAGPPSPRTALGRARSDANPAQ